MPKASFSTIRSQEHDCSYLADRKATTTFVHPQQTLTPSIYSSLLRKGFRRSGTHLYLPSCKSCEQCVSVRVASGDFTPNRAQRRTIAKNKDISVSIGTPMFDSEHIYLLRTYLHNRHSCSNEGSDTLDSYKEFLIANWCDTISLDFRLQTKLVGVAIIDVLADGLSAIYNFYSPTYKERSLGRFAILKTIELAQKEELDWVYLGYWIQNSKKMQYKSEYRPQEYFVKGQWTWSQPIFKKQ